MPSDTPPVIYYPDRRGTLRCLYRETVVEIKTDTERCAFDVEEYLGNGTTVTSGFITRVNTGR